MRVVPYLAYGKSCTAEIGSSSDARRLDQHPAIPRECRGFEPRMNTEFREDVLDVGSSGLRADHERRCDRVIVRSVRQERENLPFPPGEAIDAFERMLPLVAS